MPKERIDLLLVRRSFFSSHEQAQRAIMAGLVFVGNERIDKAGSRVEEDGPITIKEALHPYVSRGGMKLSKAFDVFQIDLEHKIVIDIGSSTGGFTDCSLQHGAQLVYAVDIGYAQLAWKLRQNKQVVVMERCNFINLSVDDLKYGQPQLATIDVSFVSIGKLFANLKKILTCTGNVIALIKPQFEAGRRNIGKGGLVKDIDVHRQVLQKVMTEAKHHRLTPLGLDYSPIQGGRTGNIEFLLYMSADESIAPEIKINIDQVVSAAHTLFFSNSSL